MCNVVSWAIKTLLAMERKTLVRIVLFGLVIIIYNVLYIAVVHTRLTSKRSWLFRRSPPANHILVTGYIKGGSSLTGKLIGKSKADAFYFYEPLYFPIGEWSYFQDNSTICNLQNLTCRWQAPAPASVRNYLGVLKSINRCQLTEVESIFALPKYEFQFGRSGPGQPWAQLRQCFNKNFSRSECLLNLETTCLNAKYIITKILRLGMDAIQQLLEEDQQQRVVHIFRDPRAVISSMIDTNWIKETSKNLSSVYLHSRLLCDRMAFDFAKSRNFTNVYPGQYLSFLFEDLLIDLGKKSAVLYDFIKMADTNSQLEPMSAKQIQMTKTVVINRPKWRHRLSWHVVTVIDSACADFYQLLGYIKFNLESEFKDLSLPTVDTSFFDLLS